MGGWYLRLVCKSLPVQQLTIYSQHDAEKLPIYVTASLLQTLSELWDDEGGEHRLEGGCSGRSMHKNRSYPLATPMSSQNEIVLASNTPWKLVIYSRKKLSHWGENGLCGDSENRAHRHGGHILLIFFLLEGLAVHLQLEWCLKIREGIS